jgi:uncharacterized protein
VSATLTSRQGVTSRLFRTHRTITVMVSVLLALATPVHAADNNEAEPKGGFFEYFPAMPDIHLPKLDIVPFWTDDLKKGRKAYENGNFGRAMKFFRRSSEDGNIVGDWYLANMYRLGQGVTSDSAVAYSYYVRVAENFDPEETDQTRLKVMVDSQLHIADYQRVGIPSADLPANPAAAARSYLKLASAYGHPGALYGLGVLNMMGEGVSKNPTQGLKWLTAAARQRNIEAEAYLGDLYWEGRDVKQNQTRAFMWYTLAVETARPEEHAAIINRYNEMRSEIDDSVRLEAEAKAKLWQGQYPASFAKGP